MEKKRMLIIDDDVVKKVDENRGDMSFSDFIDFLINNQLQQNISGQNNDNITKEEFHQFEQGIRELLRNFLEFFLSYGLELGKNTTDEEFEKLSHEIQALGISPEVRSR